MSWRDQEKYPPEKIYRPSSSRTGPAVVPDVDTRTGLAPTSGTDCSFYTACLGKVGSCGAGGYALGFGKFYCEAFTADEVYGGLDVNGKRWVDGTATCLKRSIIQVRAKKAARFFGWVFLLISLGGQAPHVLRAHMGVHRTCGEPNEINLTIRALTDDYRPAMITAPPCRRACSRPRPAPRRVCARQSRRARSPCTRAATCATVSAT